MPSKKHCISYYILSKGGGSQEKPFYFCEEITTSIQQHNVRNFKPTQLIVSNNTSHLDTNLAVKTNK